MIPGLGARLVELAEVQVGDEVLDVAAGWGNASLPAAAAGAVVTALDSTPALLEIGSQRASAAGLDVEWVHGDAQALPMAVRASRCSYRATAGWTSTSGGSPMWADV
jgi:ubiquinone/menaquinone biosynthesis C-methylase UbiE